MRGNRYPNALGEAATIEEFERTSEVNMGQGYKGDRNEVRLLWTLLGVWAAVWGVLLLWPRPQPRPAYQWPMQKDGTPQPEWNGKWRCPEGWELVARQQQQDEDLPDVACVK